MKKALALVLAAAMALSLVACSGGNSSSGSSAGSSASSGSSASTGDTTQVANKDKPLVCSTVSPPTAPPASWTWPL